eukprot:12819435-Heterocapsa_arctica.AAC.1
MASQIVKICDGVRVMGTPIRLEHFVHHAQGRAPQNEPTCTLCTVHSCKTRLKGTFVDTLQDRQELRIQ